MDVFIAATIACLIGIGIGKGLANMTTAEECDRLGGFYVGQAVFECQRAKTHDKTAGDEP